MPNLDLISLLSKLIVARGISNNVLVYLADLIKTKYSNK